MTVETVFARFVESAPHLSPARAEGEETDEGPVPNH